MKKVKALVGMAGVAWAISEGEVQEWSDFKADYFLAKGLVELAEKPRLTRSEVINALGEDLGKLLIEAGYASLSALEKASDADLLKIPGVGKASVRKIRGLH